MNEDKGRLVVALILGASLLAAVVLGLGRGSGSDCYYEESGLHCDAP